MYLVFWFDSITEKVQKSFRQLNRALSNFFRALNFIVIFVCLFLCLVYVDSCFCEKALLFSPSSSILTRVNRGPFQADFSLDISLYISKKWILKVEVKLLHFENAGKIFFPYFHFSGAICFPNLM